MLGASLTSNITNSWYSITPKSASGAVEIADIKQIEEQGWNLSQKFDCFRLSKNYLSKIVHAHECQTSHETIFLNCFKLA